MTPAKSVPLNSIQLSAGKFDRANGTDEAAITRILSGIRATNPKSLVIHFHGGLVSRESALASAQRLSPVYADAGAESLFVIWETSAPEIIAQNVRRIVEEPIFQAILVRTAEFVKGKLDKTVGAGGGKGAAGLPQTFTSEIQDELDKGKLGEPMFSDLDTRLLSTADAPAPDQALSSGEQQYIEDQINGDTDIRLHVRAIAASRAAPGGRGAQGAAVEPTLMDPEVIAEIAPVDTGDEISRSIIGTIMLGKRVAIAVGAVIWRFAYGRDHGLYLTIVEEIMRAFYVRAAGRFLWTQMKDAVATSFGREPDCGGTALVNELCRLWKESKPCITLVGHSAGAIYVGRLLQELHTAMDDPDFRANVVLIAPACTFDYLAQSLRDSGAIRREPPYLRNERPGQKNDRLVPGIYPASLLYFVSGVLEDNRDEPLVGMQRYYSNRYDGEKFATIADVKRFNCLLKEHAYAWSQTGGFDGANCDMATHGGWTDAPATLASVLFLIGKGCSNAW